MLKRRYAVQMGMERSKEMSKPSFLAQQMQMAVKLEQEKAREISRQFTLDAVILALADMGFTDFKEFKEKYNEVELEIANHVADEAKEEKSNGDKIRNIWASRDRIDRALKAALGDELFVPFEQRYNL